MHAHQRSTLEKGDHEYHKYYSSLKHGILTAHDSKAVDLSYVIRIT